jgi:hypothetical protein
MRSRSCWALTPSINGAASPNPPFHIRPKKAAFPQKQKQPTGGLSVATKAPMHANFQKKDEKDEEKEFNASCKAKGQTG